MEEDLTHRVTLLVIQISVILIAAKIGGEICERYVKIPPVLGELLVGVAIGPFALGAITIGVFGPLFPIHETHDGAAPVIPVSPELWSLAQIAAIVLLFVSGLETNLRQFLRYLGPAMGVAMGGVVFPFIFGVYATVAFGLADSFLDPTALFMGAVLTATSVGITARVLGDIRRLDSPEGVTVLAAAVVDDVLGILILTIVVGVSVTGQFSAQQVALVGAKAFGFWLGLTAIGILTSNYISRFFSLFRVSGGALALALGLAFLAAGAAEMAGLAMIIGAYSMGLALSDTDLARRLEEPMRAIYDALVPIFFVVMGMLVDLQAILGVFTFGMAITLVAILTKVIGSGAPSLLVGFNLRGAWRLGIGMLPRGEVALIVAGIGLGRGVIGPDIFGVAIMMTMITTILAPIILVSAFKHGGSGIRSNKTLAEN